MSQTIVTAFTGRVTSSPDGNEAQSTSDSTTLNATTLQSCYLCFRHAEHHYDTTPFFMAGKFYPSERRPLCTIHWLQVWRVMLESLEARVKTEICLHCYEAPALPDIVYCANCLAMYQDEYEQEQEARGVA